MSSILSYIKPILVKIISPNWTIKKDVQYGLTSEETADLYLLNEGSNPTIVFIHGGGWQSGDKSVYNEGRAKKWAVAGFNVVTINYRFPKPNDAASEWPTQLEDAQLAVRWLRANAAIFNIDPDKIVVGGDSAGGHIALFLGSLNETINGSRSSMYANFSPRVLAVLNMCGPSDLTDPEMAKLIASLDLFGKKSYQEVPERYHDASPIFKLTPQSSPTCIVHGTEDEVVPYEQSVVLSQKLTELGVYNKLITYTGGHEMNGVSSFEVSIIELQEIWFMLGYV